LHHGPSQSPAEERERRKTRSGIDYEAISLIHTSTSALVQAKEDLLKFY
jgi:hypothetical protein